MIPAQFDALSRLTQTVRSRRAVLAPAVAALFALLGDEPAAGKKRNGCKKPCGPCRRCKRGKCRPRPDGASCGSGKACAGGTCRERQPACNDGLHNGDETDVDCGGSCPTKCANGEGCSAHGDCQSGNCVGSLCRECLDGGQCAIGEACVGFACCTVDGFESIHACADDAECCSGNCATHGFGTTCRPAGCLPTGANCGGDPGVCCSFTCSGTCR